MSWPEAILFDLDGTLVDSAQDISVSLNSLLRERGIQEFSLEAVTGMIGGGVPVLIERAMAAREVTASHSLLQQMVERFLALYTPRAAERTTLFPGVREILESYATAGSRLGVCTNKPEALSRYILEQLGVGDLMGTVVGGDTGATKKPDPGPIYMALNQLGSPLASALMVGDSRADADAARAAGIPVFLVSFGYTQEPVSEIGCDGIINAFSELSGMIDRLALKQNCREPSAEN